MGWRALRRMKNTRCRAKAESQQPDNAPFRMLTRGGWGIANLHPAATDWRKLVFWGEPAAYFNKNSRNRKNNPVEMDIL